MVKEITIDSQRAIELVKTRYNSSKAANSLDFERFARYYNLFRNRQVIKNYSGLANLFIPEPYRIIRKKTAKLANAIRSIEVTAENSSDLEGAKIGTQLLNFIRRKLNWYIVERSGIQESRIVGLAWWKLVWNLDKEEEGKPYKGFDFSFHTADQILLPPDTTILDIFEGNIDYLIHVYEDTLDNIKKNRNYRQEAITTLTSRGGGSYTDKSSLEQARFLYQSQSQNINDKQKKIFKICEYWGMYKSTDNAEPKNSIIVVADNSLLLRLDENPVDSILDNPIPFVPVVANVIGKELYPIGDIEPGESLFNELNDTRNQRMDTVTLNIDPAKEVLRAAKIKEEDLIARKGWIINSSVPNGIRFIPPDMQGVVAAINEEKAIRGDIQQYSGVIDFSPGTEIQAGVSIDTARGTIIAKGEADVLVEDELQLLKTSLRMLYRIALAYAQNFLDREFTMRIVEKGVESFMSVSKESIQGNFDLDVEMKTLQDKTTDQQLKLLFLNIAKTIPGTKLGKFFTDVLEAFYGNANIQEYYEEPQPIKESPKISIALRGELSPVETDEIYKMTGADPTAADPMFREELRQAMRGNLPEFQIPQQLSQESTVNIQPK